MNALQVECFRRKLLRLRADISANWRLGRPLKRMRATARVIRPTKRALLKIESLAGSIDSVRRR